jgi:hypothetical protein
MSEWDDGFAGYGYLTDEPTIEWLLGRLDWAIERIEKLEAKADYLERTQDWYDTDRTEC